MIWIANVTCKQKGKAKNGVILFEAENQEQAEAEAKDAATLVSFGGEDIRVREVSKAAAPAYGVFWDPEEVNGSVTSMFTSFFAKDKTSS
jgi:hypothetical protein